MAGKYGSASLVLGYDDGPGGSLQTITAYVTDISGIKLEAITQQSNPFGQAYQSHTPVGVSMVGDITIHGFYDTTATSGPHVVFKSPDTDPQGSTRSFSFAPGDSKTFTMETRLVSYEVLGKNGNLTEYNAVIRQAGAGAWA
jgi:hypothetical protein